MAIPILVVIGTLSGETLHARNQVTIDLDQGGGVLFLSFVLLILLRQKYPRWWFDWNFNFLRFSDRVVAYLAPLDDRYPSTDDEQSVHLDFPYPDVRRMNRWLPLIN